MTKIYNRAEQKQKRQHLRRNATKAEAILWSRLRGKQMLEHKFRRQFGVGVYVIDFYCPELKLAIEVDGDSHFTEPRREYDQERQRFVEAFDIHFLRFTNEQIYNHIDNVLETISLAIEQKNSSKS